MVINIKDNLKRIIITLIFFILRLVCGHPQPAARSKRLLIIKLDGIGDYILFRNFLHSIRKSKKYGDYHLTLLAQPGVRILFETLDQADVDEFISFEKKNFFYRPWTAMVVAYQIYQRFAVAVQAAYSRDLIGDAFIRFSAAPERCGFQGDLNNESVSDKAITDAWYTKLINLAEGQAFEFYKNKEFFEKFCAEKIDLSAPFIDTKYLSSVYPAAELMRGIGDYVVICPGARDVRRRFSPQGFAAIADYIANHYPMTIVVAGSNADQDIVSAMQVCSAVRIIDLSGRANIVELAAIIAGARLLVGNDSAAAHLAMSVGVKTIVLSQFNHYGRFVPYPPAIARGRMLCLTPDKYRELSEEELIKKFSLGSWENIGDIALDSVRQGIDCLLKS